MIVRLRISGVAPGSSVHLHPKLYLRVSVYEAYTIITQEVYEQYPNGIPHEQFAGFENYAQFTPQQAFPGPPTPPNQHPGAVQPIIGAPRSTQSSADVLAMAKMEAEDQAQAQGGKDVKNPVFR